MILGVFLWGQAGADSRFPPPFPNLDCSFSQSQSSIPVVDLAGNFSSGQMVTPWIDVLAGHTCRASNIQPIYQSSVYSHMIKLTGYWIYPAPGTTVSNSVVVAGTYFRAIEHSDFPGFAVIVRVKHLRGWTNFDRVDGNGVFLVQRNVVEYFFSRTEDTGDVGFPREYQLALVRFGSNALPASLPAINHDVIRGAYTRLQGVIYYAADGEYMYRDTDNISALIRFRVDFKSIPATCPTPIVPGGNTRALSPVRWDELPAVGSVAKHQDLNLQFNNCSAHLSTIRYKIDPSGNSPNPGAGLLPLRAPSTAQGLAVQVLERRQSDNAWVVSSLGQWRERNVSGGSHTLPMGIRYYRTGNLVGGNVNAGMTISFQYQ